MNLLILLFFHLLGRQIDACTRSRAVVRITCPPNKELTTSKLSTTTRVSWSRSEFTIKSTHPIKGIFQTIPSYGASATYSQTFQEGVHKIEYKVVDESGNFDSCTFHVIVKVNRCDRLRDPTSGLVTCSSPHPDLHGSSCNFTCNQGFSLAGQSFVRCLGNGQWSSTIPYCKVLTCHDPGKPFFGNRLCTPPYMFGDDCTYHCDPGYKLDGQRQTYCMERNGQAQWSHPQPFCRKISPPQVKTCPHNIQRSTNTILTGIEEPLVEFITSKGDKAPHVCEPFGENKVHNFTVGVHMVKCVAHDPLFGHDTTSTCIFSIYIKANPCRPLPQPQHGFLLCSRARGGQVRFHDTSCTLFCHRGYALPRIDIPVRMHHEYRCDQAGRWVPSDQVPGCVRPKRPTELRLQTEIHFHSSNCRNISIGSYIRRSFKVSLEQKLRMQRACAQRHTDCIVEVINAQFLDHDLRPKRHLRHKHGLHRRHRRRHRRRTSRRHHRRRRSSESCIISIKFQFATRVRPAQGSWPEEYHLGKNRLYTMFDYFERNLNQVAETLKSRLPQLLLSVKPESLTFAPIRNVCRFTYMFDQETLMCVTCGAGMRYNETADQCQPCPRGTYQDKEGKYKCMPCPRGTSSIEPGASRIEHCVDIDECMSSPCGTGGRCENAHARYVCHCLPGFTGEQCETKVYDCTRHGCQNGGTCNPVGLLNYTCTCPEKFSGNRCQMPSVDGGWTEWSSWSQCSKSCDGGVRRRNRTCDHPAPSHGGKKCRGRRKEHEACNEDICPTCKKLRRPYQGTIRCVENTTADLTTCVVSCPAGYGFTSPVLPEYRCGRSTSYLWPHESPDNPRCILPACMPMSEAFESEYSFRTNFSMACDTEAIESAIRHQVSKRATELTRHLHCIQRGTCSLRHPQITGCISQLRQRRSLSGSNNTNNLESKESEVQVQVSIVYHQVPSSASHGGRVRVRRDSGGGNATPTPDSPFGYDPYGFFEATHEISEIGSSLMSQVSSGELFLTLGNKKVVADGNHTDAAAQLVCPLGLKPAFDQQYCVACSPGSHYNSAMKDCSLCEVGTYQPRPRKGACLPCAPGQVTLGRGATRRQDCYYSGTLPPMKPSRKHSFTDLKTPLHVLIPVVGTLWLSLMFSVGTAVYLRYRNRHKRKYTIENHGAGQMIGNEEGEMI